jgi:hypothetical protein
MDVLYTARFARSYDEAPAAIQRAFDKQLAFLLANLRHPSLRAKKYDVERWQARITRDAQFIAVCRRSKWSKHATNSPLLALLAMAGSNAACKISSACSNALCCRKLRRN